MCFSPQRRAIFRHLNFKKWVRNCRVCTFWLQNVLFATAACIFSTSELQKVLPDTSVFCTFSLANVLFATAACIFSTSELQKVVRTLWCFAHFDLQMCFSPQRRAIFDFSSEQHDLRTRRFNRPTFGLTRHTNHWKNTAFRDFSNIWRGCIFFLLTFALLHLLSADLTTLLCFSTVHIVGSFYLNFLRWLYAYIYRYMAGNPFRVNW